MKLAIYCAGGLGREILTLARTLNKWSDIFFIDDVTPEPECNGARIVRFEDADPDDNEIEVVIANGEPEARRILFNKVKSVGFKLATIVDYWCWKTPTTVIGEGCIVYAARLSDGVKLGENVLINAGAVIGHDAVVGNSSVISSSAFVGGYTRIGNCVFMGPGAMAKDHIEVGDNAILSLGAVALRNVRDESIIVGNPGRKIGVNSEHKVFNIF